ncbi:MAG: hypothetical protein FWD79_00850 [Desulfobulbus sp.]|nr:hypothetical protein [Desulfobulbus sp.]
MPEQKKPSPPQISPYVFPVLLAGLGLWCLYDGWLTTDPEMIKHQLFNRIASGVFLLWAIIDFIRTYKRDKAEQAAKNTESPGN